MSEALFPSATDEPDVRPAFLETVRRLSAAQKSGKGAPAYSRFVNRRLGRLLAAAAFHAGLTPNTVTVVSGLVTFLGIALVAASPAVPATGLAVAVALVVGYALDAADGQLARLRGGGSRAGEWLDHMVDAAKISSLHLAVLVGLFRSGQVDDHWLLVPVLFTVVAAVSFFAQILNEQLQRQAAGPVTHSLGGTAQGPASTVVSVLKVPTDYGVLCLLFLVWGYGSVFLVGYTALFLASAAYLALALIKWFRVIQRLDGRS